MQSLFALVQIPTAGATQLTPADTSFIAATLELLIQLSVSKASMALPVSEPAVVMVTDLVLTAESYDTSLRPENAAGD